jgi:hypothetical protein
VVMAQAIASPSAIVKTGRSPLPRKAMTIQLPGTFVDDRGSLAFRSSYRLAGITAAPDPAGAAWWGRPAGPPRA